jgi:hypothetical protein
MTRRQTQLKLGLFFSILCLFFVTANSQIFSPFAFWTNSRIVALTVSQSVVSGGIGAGATVSAQAVFTPSRTLDVTSSAVWTTSNAAVATVSNGVISFVSAGTATITAAYLGYSQTVSVTVLSVTLTSIAVTPNPISMAVNATQNFTAIATYSDASTQNVTTSVSWSSSNPSVATISNTAPTIGRATGFSIGTSTITATLGAVSGTSALTINAATLTSIAITPYDYLGNSNATFQLVATGTFSDSSTADITNSVTWSSSNLTAATISNVAGSKGLVSTVSFTGYRTTTITATLGVSGTTPFGVDGASITSIIVKPTVTVVVGGTYSLEAWANLSDGGCINVTQFAVWSSATTAKVTVSNGAGTQGVVTGVATGTSVVTAAYGGVSGTRTVTVGASASVVDVGTGLVADYYSWSGGAPPSPFIPANKKGTRVDANVDFAWGAGAAPMGISNNFATRWTGFYQATSATNYFCTYSDDGIRLWVNGTLVVNNWTDHGPTWNCTGNIALTIGTKYAIVMEFYENGGGAESHLTRDSASAAAAQSLAKAIPQVDLYPY